MKKPTPAEKASAIVAKLDAPKPIPMAEYVEAALAASDEPSADDAAAMAALLSAEPLVPAGLPCPRCAGTGMVPAVIAEPPAYGWDDSQSHALDAAPINSKIMVVLLAGKSHAVLGTPDGAKELPPGDPAHRLPEGARIRKLAEREYLAEQVSPVEDHPPITRTSASRAIADFVPHFHPTGPS